MFAVALATRSFWVAYAPFDPTHSLLNLLAAVGVVSGMKYARSRRMVPAPGR